MNGARKQTTGRKPGRVREGVADGSVDELAPLPVPEDADFGRDASRYTIRWTLAVVPPEERVGADAAEDAAEEEGTG